MGSILAAILDDLLVMFGSFREMAKFQKIAPRVGESSKIEGWRLRDRAKIVEKSLRKRDEKM